MKLKRMMAIVLCFAMVLSTMSFSVFAEDATVTVSSYDELVAALTNAETETIELAGDITIDTSITVPDGVILDLKGNTLYVNVENSYYNNVTIKNGNIVLGKDDVHVCDGYFLVNEDKALVLSDVNMSSATDGIKGYAVFHLKTGANLDLIDSTLNISDNEYAAGYIVYAGESTATVDITGTTVTGTNVNGIVYATTVIDNSTFTIGDANEHGINRSAVTINDSTVTISGGTGRGITAEHGDLVISGDSVVNISDMGEATIELRGDKNLTVDDTATVTVDVAVNNTTSGTITGDVTVDGATEPPVVNANVKIGEKTYITLQDALADAKDGDTITLIWKEGNAPIAMNGYVSGKTVTITGTAEVDWEKGFLFVGRTTDDTEASDAKLIFENATLTTTAGGDHGIHVSGAEKGSATKANGTVEIKNSNINLTYLINKGAMSLDNSTLTVKSGFSIGGRPASETESGEDATATIDLKNGSKVVVNNHNGMGLGYEAIGIMNIDESSAFECTQDFLITAKGTMNVNGTVNVTGTLNVAGTLISHGDIYGKLVKVADDAVIKIYAGKYSYDPKDYVVDGLQVVYDDLTELYTVVGTWTVSATTPTDKCYADEFVTVEVKADGANFAGATWTLKYDETKFEYQGVPSANGIIIGATEDGNSQNAFNKDTALATYTFKALAQTEEVTGKFEIINATVGTVAMSVNTLPEANKADADEVTILLKDFAATVYDNEAVINETLYSIEYDDKEHTISVKTNPVADVYYKLGDGTETTTAPVIKNPGTYKITYRVAVPDGYDQTLKTAQTITVTIGATVPEIEVTTYAGEYKLVLVYTDVDNAHFRYGNSASLMLDVTAAGYNYTDDEGNVSDHEYKHVYGYVVPSIMLDASTYADNDAYRANVKFELGGNVVPVTPYDYNVNCSANNIVDIADVIYTRSVYNTVQSNMVESCMKRILKADANVDKTTGERDKTVNTDDITIVKDNQR